MPPLVVSDIFFADSVQFCLKRLYLCLESLLLVVVHLFVWSANMGLGRVLVLGLFVDDRFRSTVGGCWRLCFGSHLIR